mmetsp:Transcript_49152/g.113904  ORF Transcript_49152/g.113904 Transcript_49152/m.113904 type:complete len:461 (-) Transcript_49152:99-1481(-)
MVQERAEALHKKLSSGKDCEEEARRLAKEVVSIPDAMLQACIGNRSTSTPACPKSLRALLEAKANPHALDQMTKGPLLHTACWHGNVDVVKLFLEFKADIEVKEPRMHTPPLNTALAAGSANVCLELLKLQASVQWQHTDGASALHVAVAWIASSHNSNLRLPPVGEEPRAVIAMILHNGGDPTQTEGMSKSALRAKGMTPLESFLREVAMSPWRTHEQIGTQFDETAKRIHLLLEQGQKAVILKNDGNAAFKKGKYQEALKAYAEARAIWDKADIRGHHSAVLWSNEAMCHRKTEDWAQCRQACEQGLSHFCMEGIRTKLQECLKDAAESEAKAAEAKERAAAAQREEEQEQEGKPAQRLRRPATQLKGGFLGSEHPDKPIYPEEGSKQGRVEKPGPFICPFYDAQEAGMVDGVDGWKDREKRRLHQLDTELVNEGYMSADLLDPLESFDLINRYPQNA